MAGIHVTRGAAATVTFSSPQQIILNKNDDSVESWQGGTWNINNVSGTVSLPTGASTSAKQDSGNTSLSSIDTKLTSQATAAKQDTGNTSLSNIEGANAKADTSSVTSVASSATTVSLLASNTARKMATFYNDSTAILYLKLGATASTSSYTLQIAAGGYYELPFPCYTGAIDGIWASANGNARITELT
jgi:hypothetical protein